METKLTNATKLSANQKTAYISKHLGYDLRSKTLKSIENINNDEYQKAMQKINIDPTFIKCSDTKDGNTITKVEKIATATQ